MDGCDRLQGVRLRVFAFFNTRCNNDKKCLDPETEKLRKEHKIEASYKDIADFVGCSDRTYFLTLLAPPISTVKGINAFIVYARSFIFFRTVYVIVL